MKVSKVNSKERIWTLVISAVLLLSISTVGLPMVSGGTLVVPEDYPTIQQAVDAANPNDTVYVREGTYYEHVTIDKPLILRGENRDTTIMDGSGSGNVVHIKANNVTIQGFTVRDGYQGIFFDHADHCKIDDVLATSCTYGACFQYSRFNTVTNIVVANDQQGITLGDRSSHHNTLQNVEAHSNTRGIVGRLGSDYTRILDSNIHHNERGIDIGWSSYWSIENTVIHSNLDKGVRIDNTRYGTLKNCEISSNSEGIQFTGWGAYYNTIVGNRIHSNNAGILLKYQARYNTMKENAIYNNNYGVYICRHETLPNHSNVFYHNYFMSNNVNAQIYEDRYTNIWDNGYPDGGNYWSDYTGVDQYSGASQTTPGGDDIGDTPYVIDANNRDNYPLMNPHGFDGDNDGIPDTEDNCPLIPNPEQEDADSDELGDACDPDDDNDGIPDEEDNCPYDSNPRQEDFDQDGLGDICDPDDDNDGILDELDACPYENPGGYDANLDGCTDRVCDLPQIVQSLELHSGIENSLVQKASNACRKFNDGNNKAAINMLNAFINEVEAQRGKKISEEDAEMLIQFAQNAIQQMQST